MVYVVGAHAPDEGRLVGHSGEVGQKLGQLHPGLTMPLELVGGTEELGLWVNEGEA